LGDTTNTVNPMKTPFWTVLVVGFHSVIANAQILHYQFNEGVGNTTASSGSVSDSLTMRDASGNSTAVLWGAPGSGPSASATDRALDLTTATGMGSGFSGPTAFLPALSPLSALNQFTITGWFRPDSTDLERAKFLQIQNGGNVMSITGLSGGPVGARNRLRLIIDDGDSFPEVDAAGDYEADWSTTNSWAFFAISYDGQSATSTINLYSGSLAGAASLSASRAGSSILFPLGGASVCIGANPSNTDPFNGYLDDFRLYGSTLTASEVEQVRLSAVPELRLSIARVDAAFVRITWATNFTDHVLEFATSLPATGWSAVSNVVSTVDDRRSVTVETGAAERVYRLRQP
jgi:hypothetical protein